MATRLHPNATQEVLAYIASLPPFAQAICKKLRSIILAADPSLTEDWKWGPHYSSNGMVCGFSGFQQHAKLTFFNGAAMKDPKKMFNHCVDNEFSRSIKYTDVSEIDEKALTAYVRESVAVNQKGFKREVKDKTVQVPDDLQQALNKNKTAAAFFNDLTYGYKKEYVEWVTTAKREETRKDRIAKVVALSKEKRKLNDKYKP
ncbi:MAG TPA: YdeI/OmpD-associated family protein [Chitinophagaceae bacterium]|nr:YdeI/OmpD-associated family protein [Chitinophagaceae bacterium]